MAGYLEVNMKPARGGVARLPAPQPMKKREDSRPVTFVFFATQEKQEPNCHEMKNPKRKWTVRTFCGAELGIAEIFRTTEGGKPSAFLEGVFISTKSFFVC